MNQTVRVLIPQDSQSREAFDLALAYSNAICEKTGARDIVLLTHTKHQLDHTSLSRFLGDRLVRSLSKGPVPLSNGNRRHAETLRTFTSQGRPVVIITYYAEIGILDFADGVRNAVGVVAVPDLPGEADAWSERWGVKVHGQEQQALTKLIEDDVVARALDDLNLRINISTGIIHPRDKEYADEVLRILRAKGHADPSDQIRSWAIRNGWKPDHAAKLEALSRKVWALKGKPSLASFHNPQERYARWKSGDS